jgi:mono/diheme cytochrome c family protein
VAAGLKPGKGTDAAASATAPTALAKSGESVTYLHVAPVFARRCAKCHTDSGTMDPAPEEYRLTSFEAALSAADRVRVVPRNPGASELVRRIRGQARPRMPFDGPPYLSDAGIELITRWVAQGAGNADGMAATVPAGARVRLPGTLSARWRLDDLPLAVTSTTRIDKSPSPGSYVEVRGHVAKDGTVTAERIRRH